MALFFLINIIIGCFLSRSKDFEGFLIANRTLGLFQSVMTINGTFIGAITLLVYTAYVFVFGISAIWIFIGYCIGFIIFSVFSSNTALSITLRSSRTLPGQSCSCNASMANLVIEVIFFTFSGYIVDVLRKNSASSGMSSLRSGELREAMVIGQISRR